MTNIIKISQKTPIAIEKLSSLLKIDVKKVVFISDEKIWNNSKRFFDDFFLKKYQNLILKNPKANQDELDKIIGFAKDFDYIIAFGSGVINDLCKLASFNLKIPYAILPSACSMNGYLSKNSSISINGHKKTVAAAPPQVLFYDLRILKSSPVNLTKAGIGDSLCFYSCYFDWYLSHLILETKFDIEPFKILSEKMSFFVNNYKKLSLKSEDFLEFLLEILLLSGQGMTIANGSYPASQSEHLIAHCLSMKYPKIMEDILHGSQIAITTLTSAKIQKKLLEKENLILKKDEFPIEKLSSFFNKEIALECKKEFDKKLQNLQKIEEINLKLQENWQNYKEKLAKIHLDDSRLKEIYSHFKLKSSFSQEILSENNYQDCVNVSKYIRNRFTCLDC